MDQNELLAMLMQGQAPKQLMMNPAPALAGLPGAGNISAPMLPQQAAPPALMATAEQRPMMQHPMMPQPSMSSQPASGGGGNNGILQMLLGGLGAGAFGGGGMGGLGGLLGLLK